MSNTVKSEALHTSAEHVSKTHVEQIPGIHQIQGQQQVNGYAQEILNKCLEDGISQVEHLVHIFVFSSKDSRISRFCVFLALKPPFACSLQKPAIVTSFADVKTSPPSYHSFQRSRAAPSETSISVWSGEVRFPSSCLSRFPTSMSGTAIFLFFQSEDTPLTH